MDKQPTVTVPPATDNGTGAQADKKPRSPAYPSLSLEDAVAKARTLHKNDGMAAMGMPVMAGHWESTVKSSAFLQWVSTLKQFGLLDELDVKSERRFKLARRALDILMLDDELNPTRITAIKAAALQPKIHREFWDKYGLKLPSDSNLIHQLVTEKLFTESAAKDLIRYYKKTLAFAKLTESDKVGTANRSVEVGDFVQWESEGALQFPESRKVTGKSPDGAFVFVDDQPTGLPIEEVRLATTEAGKVEPMTAATSTNEQKGAPAPPPNPNYKPPGLGANTKQYSLTTDTGEVIVRWPAQLTMEDYETVESWLEGIKKKIKRSVHETEGQQN